LPTFRVNNLPWSHNELYADIVATKQRSLANA
jgi:hypothetical protein